jgi:hypothetical protein
VLDANGNPQPIPDPAGFRARRQLGSFLMAYDSNFKPIVGQQVTFTTSSGTDATDRIALLEARASAGECEFVAKGFVDGRERGYVYESGMYRPDASHDAMLSGDQLKGLAKNAEQALTFTCVPPGSGYRIGIDRDADGIADGDESGH